MRTKMLLLTAALGAAGITTCMAEVYSVNAVGYVNLQLPGNSFFSLIANPLNGVDNKLATIIPTAPEGAAVLKWDPAAQTFLDPDSFYAGFGGWVNTSYEPSTTTLSPGEGAFIQMTEAATLTFVGEVPQGQLSAPVPVNFSIMSQLTPQEIGLGATGFPAGEGDSVLFWDNNTQGYLDPLSYFSAFGGWVDTSYTPSDPTPKVGQAFFYFRDPANSATTWTRTFSVNP